MMRKEKLFSKDGCYSRVVESNALFHKEAISHGADIIRRLLGHYDSEQTINVLDLACGAEPVSITQILGYFPATIFSYTGIDINPDQVEYAKLYFEFPENVSDINIVEGNAWDPISCLSGDNYDIIFMGLNLHHGTPEEVYYLATQINKLLSTDGVYLNHDVYRPNSEPYLRRPDHHPGNINDSFRLLDASLIGGIQLPEITNNEEKQNVVNAQWRQNYSELLRHSLIKQYAGDECAESTFNHVNMRDYPISLNDFSYIFKKVNKELTVKIIRYGNEYPLMEFIAMPVVTKSNFLFDDGT